MCLVQVLDPDPDEAAVVGQVLGTRGDITYDEYGSLPLDLDQVQIDVLFLYEKTTTEYRFDYAYVENLVDPNAAEIRVVITDRSALGFTVLLSAAIPGADYVFRWHVATPDPLQRNQSLTSGPRYQLAVTTEKGLTALVLNQDSLAVVFVTPKADAFWSFLVFSIENVIDAAPMVLSYIVKAKATTGFTVQFSGAPDTANYKLRWEVK